MHKLLEMLHGALPPVSRDVTGKLVRERYRFGSWPGFEYEVGYDPEGPGWSFDHTAFVRAPGTPLPDGPPGPPTPWKHLKHEVLPRYEDVRVIDTWGSYDSYVVRDENGASLFLSSSRHLLLEIEPMPEPPSEGVP